MILITGAGGYLGKNLIETLDILHSEYLITKHDSNFSLQGKIIYCNLVDPLHIKKFIELNFPIAIVIHLAGYIDIKLNANTHNELIPGNENLYKIYESNTIMSANILNLCLELKIKKLIFASSQTVYGYPTNNNAFLENSSFAPLEHYANSKICSEEMFKLGAKSGLDVIVLRFCGLWGKNRENGFVYTMLESAKVHKKIVINCKVPLPIDVIHVADAIDAIIKAIEVPKNGYHIYNVSTGEPCSLLLIAKTICEVLPQTIIQNTGVEQPIITMCNKKIKTELKFFPLSRRERISEMLL